MKAKHINEFHKQEDPLKALKLGKYKYKIPPDDIEFEKGYSEAGYPKITWRIKGHKPRWSVMWRGEPGNSWGSRLTMDLIFEFLNTLDTKIKISEKLENANL